MKLYMIILLLQFVLNVLLIISNIFVYRRNRFEWRVNEDWARRYNDLARSHNHQTDYIKALRGENIAQAKVLTERFDEIEKMAKKIEEQQDDIKTSVEMMKILAKSTPTYTIGLKTV